LVIWLLIFFVIVIVIWYGYGTIEDIGAGINKIQDLYETDTIQDDIEFGSELVERGIEHLKNNAQKMAEDNQN